MTTLRKLHEQVTSIREKLITPMPEWANHVKWAKEEIERIKVAEPRPFDRFTWPSQQCFLEALDRLEAIDGFIKRRKDALLARGRDVEHTTLQKKMCDILLLPSEGVETVIWQLTSALADLEDAVEDDSYDVAREETMVTATYEYLLDYMIRMMQKLESDSFITACSLQDEVERIKSRLWENTDLEDDERLELEEILTRNRRRTHVVGASYQLLSIMKSVMTDVDVNISRQTLITDYCDDLGLYEWRGWR